MKVGHTAGAPVYELVGVDEACQRVRCRGRQHNGCRNVGGQHGVAKDIRHMKNGAAPQQIWIKTQNAKMKIRERIAVGVYAPDSDDRCDKTREETIPIGG